MPSSKELIVRKVNNKSVTILITLTELMVHLASITFFYPSFELRLFLPRTSGDLFLKRVSRPYFLLDWPETHFTGSHKSIKKGQWENFRQKREVDSIGRRIVYKIINTRGAISAFCHCSDRGLKQRRRKKHCLAVGVRVSKVISTPKFLSRPSETNLLSEPQKVRRKTEERESQKSQAHGFLEISLVPSWVTAYWKNSTLPQDNWARPVLYQAHGI